MFSPAETSDSFTWFDCDDSSETHCTPIDGESDQTYKLTDSDINEYIAVVVTGTNSAGAGVVPISGATANVLPKPARNTSPPTIVGTAYVGQKLYGYTGTWADPRTTYEVHWLECEPGDPNVPTDCESLANGDGDSYTVRRATWASS